MSYERTPSIVLDPLPSAQSGLVHCTGVVGVIAVETARPPPPFPAPEASSSSMRITIIAAAVAGGIAALLIVLLVLVVVLLRRTRAKSARCDDSETSVADEDENKDTVSVSVPPSPVETENRGIGVLDTFSGPRHSGIPRHSQPPSYRSRQGSAEATGKHTTSSPSVRRPLPAVPSDTPPISLIRRPSETGIGAQFYTPFLHDLDMPARARMVAEQAIPPHTPASAEACLDISDPRSPREFPSYSASSCSFYDPWPIHSPPSSSPSTSPGQPSLVGSSFAILHRAQSIGEEEASWPTITPFTASRPSLSVITDSKARM
ncbi:hypothetical protein PsYK624_099500 [Phanerochaete sordida]|uniref:Uncharacterized protein n=1 Tax=Phanerochaete sordida TaxID=48140 RepID=A0A9P3GF67_9APHY|nr:hypothetical protein PsYK624_099500 [Phanerochaete sordida]